MINEKGKLVAASVVAATVPSLEKEAKAHPAQKKGSSKDARRKRKAVKAARRKNQRK